MDILIRRTDKNNFLLTENITREAFWNIYKPGCDEHLVLHHVRNSQSYIAELDLVAVSENEIIGHVISTKANVIDVQNHKHEVLCVGPISVVPDLQKKGVGSKLMLQSIQVAKNLGYKAMILFGDPEYYHRFGFINAGNYSIITKEGENFEPFMALELQRGGLENVKGRFFEDAAFVTNPEELIEYEKQFPYKEKLITDTQLNH